jgi:hypothetical protein
VEYRSSVYVLGGFKETTRDLPTDEGLSTYITDPESDMRFNQFSDNPPLYFQLPDEDNPVLPRPRAYHTSLAVEDGYGSAFVYVLGGRSNEQDSNDQTASDAVYVYSVTNEPPPSSIVVSESRFVSRVLSIEEGSDEQKIETISWETDFPKQDANTDMQLEYRKANLPSCSEADLDNFNVEWVQMDGDPDTLKFSKDGYNEFKPTDEENANCFQYRVRFVTSGGTRLEEAPKLMNLNLRVFLPGSPDLWAKTLEPVLQDVDGVVGDIEVREEDTLVSSFAGLNLTIRNEYEEDSDLTLPASPNPKDENGSFYVDLFVFGRGFNETQVLTPSLPLSTTAYIKDSTIVSSTLYTLVVKKNLPKNEEYSIPANSWYESTCLDTSNCQPVNLGSLFTDVLTETGTFSYTLCTAIDSYTSNLEDNPFGFVWEGMPGGEDNNFSCRTFPVTVAVETPPTPTATTNTLTPTISVANGTLMGGFQINLSPSLTETIDLPFRLTEGSGLNRGSNYDLYLENGGTAELMSANSVTLAPNQGSATLGVFLTDDSPALDGKELTLTLNQPPLGAKYEVGVPDSATITFRVEQAEPVKIYLPLVAR